MATDAHASGIPLYAHTIKSLCNELVSGRPVYLDDETELRFDSTDVRAVFSWYAENEAKWAGQNRREDVEKIVDRLGKEPRSKPPATTGAYKTTNRCLHLSKIRAHRFAGIHKYGDITNAPEDFEYTFDRPVTLIEGKNGSGKTSLLNAITWCLTGSIYRSQRAPEKVEKEIEITTGSDDTADSVAKSCMAITPIPDSDTVRSLNSESVPPDTWVELTFVDDNDNEECIKRSLIKTPRGKTSIEVTRSDYLGLYPTALEVGTAMAGLIPYIQLEETSDMGTAIAALTPLKPLEELVKHARKSQQKLKGDLRREREAEIADIDIQFADVATQFEILITAPPGIDLHMDLPRDLTQKKVSQLLKGARTRLDELDVKGLEACKAILGPDFDTKDAKNRNDLRANVGKALGLLDLTALKRLPSAQRLAAMRKLTDEKMKSAEILLGMFLEQASEIEQLVLQRYKHFQ